VVTVTRITTPLGPMVAGSIDDALCLLEFADRRMIKTQVARLRKRLGCVFVPGESGLFGELTTELDRYFRGGLKEFSIPLLAPGTDFQRSVWNRLRAIPSGARPRFAPSPERMETIASPS